MPQTETNVNEFFTKLALVRNGVISQGTDSLLALLEM